MLVEWLTTVDHKRVGILYGASAFIFFLIGGLEAEVIRLQLMKPDNHLVSPEFYNQLFTMHGTTMIFLAVMPISAMFFNFFVPLLIGARDVAFPRLNAMSLWVFILGGLFLNFSFLLSAAPNGGWFGYAPLSSRAVLARRQHGFLGAGPADPRHRVAGGRRQLLHDDPQHAGARHDADADADVRLVGAGHAGAGAALVPGDHGRADPAHCRSDVRLELLLVQRLGGGSGGGDPMLWQHLFWVFGHPEVYILILPAFGIVSEILPVFSRKPLFGYSAMVFSMAFIAFLGFGVWSHHMFATGMGPLADSFFSLMTMLIAIPTGVKIFNWIGTLWGGSLQFKTPLYFALGFIAMFIMGGLSGVMHAVAAGRPAADRHATSSWRTSTTCSSAARSSR